MMPSSKQRGFTIVELLIVIVVIAILSAIATTSYSSLQARANNSRTEKAVSDFRKSLIAYATVNGRYPAGGSASTCLGEQSIYPSGCFNGSVNATFNEELKDFLGSGTLPEPYAECLYMYGGCRRGASFSRLEINLDGSSHSWSITYLLKGDVKCAAGGQTGGTWINALSTPNTYGRIEYHSGTTLCRLSLPDPSSL